MAENGNPKDPATVPPPDYHRTLRAFERTLIGMRDEAQNDIETFPPLADYYQAQLSAFQRVVGVLHIHTEGAFGQSYADQVVESDARKSAASEDTAMCECDPNATLSRCVRCGQCTACNVCTCRNAGARWASDEG